MPSASTPSGLAPEDDGAAACIQRARSHIEAQKLELGLSEAEKASKIDTRSIVAWTCLAEIQYMSLLFRESVTSYKRAQSCLPAEDVMSESDKELNAELDKKLMQSLTDELKSVRASATAQSDGISFVIHHGPVFHPVDALNTINQTGRRPWERAMSIRRDLTAKGDKTSSAFVIPAAYREYNGGVQSVLIGKHEPGRSTAMFGAAQWILEGLCGIPVVASYHRNSTTGFNHINYEIKLKRGWDKTCSYDRVRRELQDRVRQLGWHSERPGLRSTVQAWVLYAFNALYIARQPVLAFKYFKQAVNIIEFGRSRWPSVHRDDRGAIFENTFLSGVKRMTLPAYMDPKHPDQMAKHHLDELEDFANTLISAAERTTPAYDSPGTDWAMITTYWLYPVAEGYSALGWVNHRRAEKLMSTSPRAALERFKKASADYIRAADVLNEDEEYHAHYLSVAVECMCISGTPFKDIFPICARIRTSLPKLKRIWAISQISASRDIRLQQVLDFETEYKRKVQRGEISIDDLARPRTWGDDRRDEKDEAFVVLKD